MIPSVEHLTALSGDVEAFEAERNRIISSYIKSLPEHQRVTAYAMQCKIDLARLTLSPEEFAQWMAREAVELATNLEDQLSFLKHKLQDLQRELKSESGG